MDYSSIVPQTTPNSNNATMLNSVDELNGDHYGHVVGEVEQSQRLYYQDREEDEGYYGEDNEEYGYNGEENEGYYGDKQWYNNEEYGYNEDNYDSYGYCNCGCYSNESCYYDEQWYDASESFNDEGCGPNESFDLDSVGDFDLDSVGGDVGDDDGDRTDNSDDASVSEGASRDGDDDEVEGEDGWKLDAPVTCFKTCCVVYPLSHIGKSHLEVGNKIILPNSALEDLMNIGVDYPMLFKVGNPDNGKSSHCGVLEFSSEEGMAVMPEWMMNNLSVEAGCFVNLESVTLEKATYVKLQPHKTAFLDIKNPKPVLENAFCLGYSCLTVGDTIVVTNEGQKMYLDVVDAKPSNAVCMIDTDVEVDFALPLDYKEPEKPVPKTEEPTKFVPFTGTARRLNDTGKSSGESSSTVLGGGSLKSACLTGKNGSGESSSMVFGGGSLKSTCSDGLTKPSSDEKTLKPFTGKKYRLMDS